MRVRSLLVILALGAASFAVTRLVVRSPANGTAEGTSGGAVDRIPTEPAAGDRAHRDRRFQTALQALGAALTADAGLATDPGNRVAVPETLSPLQEATVRGEKADQRWAAWRVRTDLTMTIERRIARCWEKPPKSPVVFEVKGQVRTAGTNIIAADVILGRMLSDEMPSVAERNCIDEQIRGEHPLPNGETVVAALGQVSSQETVVVRSP